jgi:hypothetical protein
LTILGGTQNGALSSDCGDPNTGVDCDEWHTTFLLQPSIFTTDFCFWALNAGLPCKGTFLSFELQCTGGGGEVRMEASIWEGESVEDHNLMGDWRLTDVSGETTDCEAIGELGPFIPSAFYTNNPNLRRCNFDNTTVRIDAVNRDGSCGDAEYSSSSAWSTSSLSSSASSTSSASSVLMSSSSIAM